ncbi:undecaprenyl pyrophosphate synthetase [Isoalcanivorax pacificus W11-5]|uniref:Ditrans,polycis-undecaprenyl-diphosphate synthase ((2E,6E)-farnesyl-diphosphate specific) n=2 Tax=Isoalcanivorax TaxID=3020833 RepID=A0A0B4XQW2_9GAMM|nr:undecaprenyl pyrophosphate synthetase [Isoalcanivorax pacificus W11-5]
MSTMQDNRSKAPDVDSVKASGVPRHVAIIMDGNNRWARRRGLPGHEGHRAGERAVQSVISGCARRGVEVLTLFAFSSENWRRPEDEVRHLMGLFMEALGDRVRELHEHRIRLRFIGERSAFSAPLQQGMAAAEQLTADNKGMVLAIAVNYGGQWDVTQAARRLAEDVAAGRLAAAGIDEHAVQGYLALGDLPPPDLLIRTGGECRLSNFLLWQAAYSELFFSPLLWPDFNEQALAEALRDYAGRQRRFGRSGEQVAGPDEDTTC